MDKTIKKWIGVIMALTGLSTVINAIAIPVYVPIEAMKNNPLVPVFILLIVVLGVLMIVYGISILRENRKE